MLKVYVLEEEDNFSDSFTIKGNDELYRYK